MILDAKLAFSPANTPLSLVGAAGVAIVAPLIIDLLGNGPGTLVQNIWGISTLPGQPDAHGMATQRPELVVNIGTALVADTGTPTLTVELSGAPDDGAGSPGTYQVLEQGPPLSVAQGVAGQSCFRAPWVPPSVLNLRPRFLRMRFLLPSGTNFAAGTIAFAGVSTVRDDPFQLQVPRNYRVAGVA